MLDFIKAIVPQKVAGVYLGGERYNLLNLRGKRKAFFPLKIPPVLSYLKSKSRDFKYGDYMRIQFEDTARYKK
jgi:hypothetical protein